MIKNIIFDIGRVLIYYNWKQFLLEEFGDQKTADTLYDAFFGHGLWNEMDRGVLTEDELTAAFARYAPGYEEQIRSFTRSFAVRFRQHPYAKPWIRSLRSEGFGVYYLSNYCQQAVDANPEVLDFTDLMDGGVFSYLVRLIKPDPAIYRLICERYSLEPEECVFIDDKQVNVDAARAFGMQAFVFTGYEDASKRLESLVRDRV